MSVDLFSQRLLEQKQLTACDCVLYIPSRGNASALISPKRPDAKVALGTWEGHRRPDDADDRTSRRAGVSSRGLWRNQ